MLSPLGHQALNSTARSSAAGEVLDRHCRQGGDPIARDNSAADRAENPASRRVTVLMATSPRSTRSAHLDIWADPSRTRADLSISQDIMSRHRT